MTTAAPELRLNKRTIGAITDPEFVGGEFVLGPETTAITCSCATHPEAGCGACVTPTCATRPEC